jgi:hypothetical protein
MPSRRTGVRVSALVVAVVASTAACLMQAAGTLAAPCTPTAGCAPPTGPELTLGQVRQMALRVSKSNGDPHPTSILFASGSLRNASRVKDPSGVLYPHPTPQQEAELNSTYYLVVIRGRFPLAYAVHSQPPIHPRRHSHSQHPRPIRPVVPSVIELLIPARVGYAGLSSFYCGAKVPAPLRRLGPVTVLLERSARPYAALARVRVGGLSRRTGVPAASRSG